jgi:hypothetical protein
MCPVSQTAGSPDVTIDGLTMSGNATIRKVLTAMLALVIVLWAEAGLALVAGDRVMACHTMMVHAPASTMAASDDSNMADSDAMPRCPSQAGVLSANHPPCCSVSNDAERPLAFLVTSERTTQRLLDAAATTASSFVPTPAQYFGEMLNADAPHFVKPILELKTDLRI